MVKMQHLRVLCTTLMALASCNADSNLYQFYNEFAEEVMKPKEIETAIRAYLPKTENTTNGGIDPVWFFLDASTKIPSGISGGNLFDLGNFDECYNIQVDDIYGKYCLGTLALDALPMKYLKAFNFNVTETDSRLQISPKPRQSVLGSEYVGFHWASCVPSTMSAKDIPGLSIYTEEFCYSKATKPKLSLGAIATILIFAVVLAIAAISTVYDIYFHYTKETAPHTFLTAFSFFTNGRKIFKLTSSTDQLSCLDGIRALSLMWIILGHECFLIRIAPLYSFLDVNETEQDPVAMFIIGSTVSVDTFLVVGGLVTVYTFLKSMNKGAKFNLVYFYVHRYLRLTPVLAMTVLVHLFLLRYLGSGPVWASLDKTLGEICREGWWSTLLYINNYAKGRICVVPSWYLSMDMQLFVLSPVVLIPLLRWPKPTVGALGFLAVVGCVVPFAIAFRDNFRPLLLGDASWSDDFIKDYYIQTHARFGPFVIGMILGYFVYRLKTKQLTIKMSKLVACIFWLAIVTVLVICVYAGYPLINAAGKDRWGNALFLAFDRAAWSVAVCGVILLCVSGYGQPVDWFLSLPIFQFITKMSYSMYLVNYTFITIRYASMKNTIKFSNIGMMHVFWADFMATLGLSLVLCFLFESPVKNLEEYIFANHSPRRMQREENLPSV